MAKYSDEELSRVLGEHAAMNLLSGGAPLRGAWLPGLYPVGCVNQVAFNEYDTDVAYERMEATADWFDNNYSMYMSPEEMLDWPAST